MRSAILTALYSEASVIYGLFVLLWYGFMVDFGRIFVRREKAVKNVLGIVLILLSFGSQARDDKLFFAIEEAMSTPDAKVKLDQGVKFVFGKDVGNATSRLGTFTSNRKTNAFNKSDQEACYWVFLSSMIALQQRALAEGGNAVVNIHSYYKKKAFESQEKFECHAGAFVAGVALRGTVVKLP